MAVSKVGPLIKEARTKASLTQQQLADKINGLSASDISKAERGEKELTQAQLKAIAKATGVTQKSLLEAAAGTGAKTGSAGKTTSTGKTSSAQASASDYTLTASEKKLIDAYRKATSDAKKEALKILKGEQESSAMEELLASLLGGAAGGSSSSSSSKKEKGAEELLNALLGKGSGKTGKASEELLSNLVSGAMDSFFKKGTGTRSLEGSDVPDSLEGFDLKEIK